MNRADPPRSVRLLMWFGLFGAPIAWAAQHLAGFGISQARCDAAGVATWHFNPDPWWVALTAVAVLVAVASLAASIIAWRKTRDTGDALPGSRVHFLSVIGMTIGPLFITIILMSGLGAVLLPQCLQS